ncbi:MAG: hypothetical protein HC898_08235 [Phycisphaerales bacterium]|nr:hypothetical protein [Phycisphaerales bacterium]
MTYEEIVRKMSELDSDEFISNSQPAHAAILYRIMFERAKHKISIFCHNLNAVVFDPLAEHIKPVVDRGVRISIIVQETPESKIFKNKFEELSFYFSPNKLPFFICYASTNKICD